MEEEAGVEEAEERVISAAQAEAQALEAPPGEELMYYAGALHYTASVTFEMHAFIAAFVAIMCRLLFRTGTLPT